MAGKIPWDTVRMITLRNLCQELGAPHWGALRKEEMIAFLQVANEKGGVFMYFLLSIIPM
jgi:hypothetical protein